MLLRQRESKQRRWQQQQRAWQQQQQQAWLRCRPWARRRRERRQRPFFSCFYLIEEERRGKREGKGVKREKREQARNFLSKTHSARSMNFYFEKKQRGR